MYPLVEPSLNEINKQLPKVNSIDEVKFNGQSQYTNTCLLYTSIHDIFIFLFLIVACHKFSCQIDQASKWTFHPF